MNSAETVLLLPPLLALRPRNILTSQSVLKFEIDGPLIDDHPAAPAPHPRAAGPANAHRPACFEIPHPHFCFQLQGIPK